MWCVIVCVFCEFDGFLQLRFRSRPRVLGRARPKGMRAPSPRLKRHNSFVGRNSVMCPL